MLSLQPWGAAVRKATLGNTRGRSARVRRAAVAAAIALLLALGAWTGARVRAGMGLAAAAYSLRGRVVAVDPGHGGIDPGALGPDGLNEDTVVWGVSVRLAAMLERAGAVVVLTRSGETPVTGTTSQGPSERRRIHLRQRVLGINAAGADVAVSVHANHFSNPSERGAQVFYNPERFPQSKELALLLQTQLARVVGGTRRVVSEHINHYFLNHTDMPAATVEIGFLSNPQEAKRLAQPDYQERIAYAIYTGLAYWSARLPTAPRPDVTGPSSPHPHTASRL